MSKQVRKRKYAERVVEADSAAPKPKSTHKPVNDLARQEEEKLSKILFGGSSSFLQSLEEAEQEPCPSSLAVDSGVGETDSDDSTQDRKPVWNDEDDDGIDVGQAFDVQGRRLNSDESIKETSYASLLRSKFISKVGTPSWAKLDRKKRDNSDSEDDEILQSTGFVKKTAKLHLPPSTLELKKVKDLNYETRSEGPTVRAVEFHPTSSVALVAGHSGVATLYAVDGKHNNKLHSLKLESFPVYTGKFCRNGNEAIFGSKFPYMYSFDLLAAKTVRIPVPYEFCYSKRFVVSPDGRYVVVSGKSGQAVVLSGTTKEKLFVLKQNSYLTSLAFNPQSSLLFGHGKTGEVTVWDMNMRRVKHIWIDDGCIEGSSINVSPSNQFLATGSAHGVVNLYNLEDALTSKAPEPLKRIFNLTTYIKNVKFNSSSELLSFHSDCIQNSVKLFHLGSKTVFTNFPAFNSTLKHVTVLNHSPGSGYLALGNNKSTVALYRLKHYNSY